MLHAPSNNLIPIPSGEGLGFSTISSFVKEGQVIEGTIEPPVSPRLELYVIFRCAVFFRGRTSI